MYTDYSYQNYKLATVRPTPIPEALAASEAQEPVVNKQMFQMPAIITNTQTTLQGTTEHELRTKESPKVAHHFYDPYSGLSAQANGLKRGRDLSETFPEWFEAGSLLSKTDPLKSIESSKRLCKAQPVFQVIKSKAFNVKFKKRYCVDMDSYKIKNIDKINSLMTDGVGPCLVLIVKCLDKKRVGLGHFRSIDTEPFGEKNEAIDIKDECKTTASTVHQITRKDRNNNLIKEFLDKVCKGSNVFVLFAAGMYSNEEFAAIEQRILQEYKPITLEKCINPWNMPKNYCTRPDENEQLAWDMYDTQVDFSLKVGITKDGDCYVADDDETPNSIQFLGSNGFVQYDEMKFQKWFKEEYRTREQV